MAYLDHAATTPMHPVAAARMGELLVTASNPSSLHAAGRRARRLVEESREQVARALGCRPAEVVFTSGGTEANNIAIKGIAWDQRQRDALRTRILIGAAEHHAILDPADWMSDTQDFIVERIPVDEFGRVTVETLHSAINGAPETVALISVMVANNEVGTINDIAELTASVNGLGIRFHTDAVQAPAWVDVNFAELGVCAMTVSAHKVGGPHGVGALIIHRDCTVTPLVHGGGQERDIRSGTLDTPAIVGFATALEIAVTERIANVKQVSELRDDLVRAVQSIDPSAIYNGDPSGRIANNAHFTFPNCLGDSLLMLLDAAGVECSVGSACNAGVPQPSHVLLAMGADEDSARCTLRFTLGPTSVQADIDKLTAALPQAIDRARRAGVPKAFTSVDDAYAGEIA